MHDASHLGYISTGADHQSVAGHKLVLLQTTHNYNDDADTHTANRHANSNIYH